MARHAIEASLGENVWTDDTHIVDDIEHGSQELDSKDDVENRLGVFSRPLADIINRFTFAPLRPPSTMYNEYFKDPKDKTRCFIGQKLKDGFVLTCGHTATGLVVETFFRGLCVSRKSRHPLFHHLLGNLSSAEDLKFLNSRYDDSATRGPRLGPIDITYSVAWKFGASQAAKDQNFCSALSRLRTDILENANSAIATIHNRTKLSAKRLRAEYEKATINTTLNLIRSQDGNLYDGTNLPKSEDWAVVFHFLLGFSEFTNIPPTPFPNFTDRSYIPPESLLFFYIDENWIDAMIDGALSERNSTGKGRDIVKISIEKAYQMFPNVYLEFLVAGEPDVEMIGQANAELDILIILMHREPKLSEVWEMKFELPPQYLDSATFTIVWKDYLLHRGNPLNPRNPRRNPVKKHFPKRTPKPRPKPTRVDGENLWLVEAIIDSRSSVNKTGSDYLVRRKNTGPESDTWEPEGNVRFLDAYRDFLESRPILQEKGQPVKQPKSKDLHQGEKGDRGEDADYDMIAGYEVDSKLGL